MAHAAGSMRDRTSRNAEMTDPAGRAAKAAPARKRTHRPTFGGKRRRQRRGKPHLLVASAICVVTAIALAAIGMEFVRGLRGGRQVAAVAPQFVAPHYKVGAPYRMNGVWYRPVEDHAYRKVGIASYYGGETLGIDFHGRQTANGEIYDMHALTAAHPTLPMPSLVNVTNLENGRSLVLRVNDRGPYMNGRIIDVSRGAAQQLGFEQKGTARVRVEVLAAESLALKQEMLRKQSAR
jgi:rare lipoprotein A